MNKLRKNSFGCHFPVQRCTRRTRSTIINSISMLTQQCLSFVPKLHSGRTLLDCRNGPCHHDRLISVLERNCRDKMLIRLIRRYLRTGILADGLVIPRDEGTPQGSPLSPILSLIVLDELDKYLEKRGLKFCRYADDCNYTLGPSAPGSACWKTRSSSSRSRSSCGLIATRAASFALEEQKCKKPEPLRSTVGTRPHPTQERSERKGGTVRMRASYRVPLFSK